MLISSRTSVREIGALAGGYLRRMVAGQEVAPTTTRLPGRLIVRQSTGPCRREGRQ